MSIEAEPCGDASAMDTKDNVVHAESLAARGLIDWAIMGLPSTLAETVRTALVSPLEDVAMLIKIGCSLVKWLKSVMALRFLLSCDVFLCCLRRLIKWVSSGQILTSFVPQFTDELILHQGCCLVCTPNRPTDRATPRWLQTLQSPSGIFLPLIGALRGTLPTFLLERTRAG